MPPLRNLSLPLVSGTIQGLKAGDTVSLSGTIYTARDAAHQRVCIALEKGILPPFPLKNATIFYVGPTPPAPGQVVGAAGPTTSYRMDAFTPALIEAGVRGMIGKGPRGPEVVEAIKQYGAVYFAATGGAGALLAKCIQQAEVVAYNDLGTEAIRRLEVKDFPAIVAIDCNGNSLYS